MRIAVEELEWVLAHGDPEVVFGFCEEAVRVDELESARRFERIPLMDITVNKDGSFVAMRRGATLCAREGVVDGALRTWVIEFCPGRGDEVGEPTTLLGAGWQTAARRRSPNAHRRGAEDLVPSADG